MSMTVKRKKETYVKKVIQHRIADIRGGVTVQTATLGGDFLFEGTALGVRTNDGLAPVIKYAKLVTAATNATTGYEVAKGHHFKVGEFAMSADGAKAYAITAIDKSNASKDVITLGTTLGVAIAVGPDGYLIEAAGESASNTSALKYVPQSINGTNYQVKAGDNIFTDAWLIAVTKDNIPNLVLNKLKGIINI